MEFQRSRLKLVLNQIAYPTGVCFSRTSERCLLSRNLPLLNSVVGLGVALMRDWHQQLSLVHSQVALSRMTCPESDAM